MRLTPLEMLEKLVSFPTVSSVSNLELVDFVEQYLKDWGVRSWRVYDDSGQKANLYAHIGPWEAGGVVLSGHTDVVPVEGQPWATDPFTVTQMDGRLYGRGTCDMKGYDACVLAAVPDMVAADLRQPIQIALSYDEEVGCTGAPRMIAEMRERLPVAATVLVGEPSMMQVVTGHKGILGLLTRIRGHEVHSSLVHTGVSAVMTAARMIEWHRLQTAENAARAEGPFQPPYTTLHCGTISGGTASNITARDCRFSTDIRTVPTEDAMSWLSRYKAFIGEVESEMRAIHPESGITVDIKSNTPGLRPEQGGPAEVLARALTGDNGDHVVSYATEGGLFQEAGFSTVVCGPGNIEQAHQPNEYISVNQFEQGVIYINKLIKRSSR